MSRFLNLRKKLEDNGWDIRSIEVPNDQVFESDIWELISKWNPYGAIIYVVFFIDYSGTCNKKDRNGVELTYHENLVWDVKLTKTIAPNLIDTQYQYDVYLNNRFEDGCHEIVQYATKLRDSM